MSNDKLILTHKIEIKPNKTVIRLLNNYFGYSRYIFNKGLSKWNEMYSNNLKPTGRKVRDKLKSNKEEWENKLSPQILDTSIEDLDKAWKMFFKGISNKPKFKSKRKSKNSCRFYRKNDSTMRIKDNKLFLPKFPYGIKLTEIIRFDGIIKTCTISKKANKYFASFTIELSQIEKDNMFRINFNDNTKCGIDLGLKTFATIATESDEEWLYEEHKGIYKNILPLYKRISHYQKILSRKEKDSNKYNIVKTKLQKLYLRISNIQKDYLNKLTTDIIMKYNRITIENLSSKFMLKNKNLAKKASRLLFYTFRVMLEAKSRIYGNKLVLASKHFASTQICCYCGFRKQGSEKLKLSDRTYHCNNCNETIDRDVNAAINLMNYKV